MVTRLLVSVNPKSARLVSPLATQMGAQLAQSVHGFLQRRIVAGDNAFSFDQTPGSVALALESAQPPVIANGDPADFIGREAPHFAVEQLPGGPGKLGHIF